MTYCEQYSDFLFHFNYSPKMCIIFWILYQVNLRCRMQTIRRVLFENKKNLLHYSEKLFSHIIYYFINRIFYNFYLFSFPCARNSLSLLCFFCIGNACATIWSFIRKSSAVCTCMSNYVCDLGTSTNSQCSPRFWLQHHKRHVNCTYRHSNSNPRLFPTPRQCGCSPHPGESQCV